MKDQVQMVRDFMIAFEQHVPEGASLDGYPFQLRAALVLEEAVEFALACGYRPATIVTNEKGQAWRQAIETIGLDRVGSPDWPEMIDALCDQLYVTFGAFVSMGIDPLAFFAEVHRTNMEKADGPVDDNGKKLKPEGWEPPKIGEMLRAVLLKEGEADD